MRNYFSSTTASICLFYRVKGYINNGLDKKYLRDPDGGINVLRKKAETGVLSESQPQHLDKIPKEGYITDLSKIPKVTFGTVWKFMIETVAFKKQISTAKPLVKGYNFLCLVMFSQCTTLKRMESTLLRVKCFLR